MTDRWKRHVCGWLLNGQNNPLHIVKFEELQENTPMEMSKILAFYGGSGAAFASRVKVGYNKFHRNHTDLFHHFTVAQEGYVVNAIKEVIETLRHYSTDSYIIEILHSYIISEPYVHDGVGACVCSVMQAILNLWFASCSSSAVLSTLMK